MKNITESLLEDNLRKTNTYSKELENKIENCKESEFMDMESFIEMLTNYTSYKDVCKWYVESKSKIAIKRTQIAFGEYDKQTQNDIEEEITDSFFGNAKTLFGLLELGDKEKIILDLYRKTQELDNKTSKAEELMPLEKETYLEFIEQGIGEQVTELKKQVSEIIVENIDIFELSETRDFVAQVE